MNDSRLKTIVVLLSAFLLTQIFFLLYSYFNSISYYSIIVTFLNRGLSTTASFSIITAYLISNLKKMGKLKEKSFFSNPKYFGLYGFFIAFSHVFISLMLIEYSRYPFLFEKIGYLSIAGQLFEMFGIIIISSLIIPAITSISSVRNNMNIVTWKKYQRSGYIAVVFILAHVTILESISKSPSFILSIILLTYGLITLSLKIYTNFKYKEN